MRLNNLYLYMNTYTKCKTIVICLSRCIWWERWNWTRL